MRTIWWILLLAVLLMFLLQLQGMKDELRGQVRRVPHISMVAFYDSIQEGDVLYVSCPVSNNNALDSLVRMVATTLFIHPILVQERKGIKYLLDYRRSCNGHRDPRHNDPANRSGTIGLHAVDAFYPKWAKGRVVHMYRPPMDQRPKLHLSDQQIYQMSTTMGNLGYFRAHCNALITLVVEGTVPSFMDVRPSECEHRLQHVHGWTRRDLYLA